MNTKSSIFTSGGATSENTFFGVMSEIKIDLTLKKSNFLFLLCFKIAKIKFITMRQQSRQKNSFYSSRFTSNLMIPACLLGVILVVNEFATEK